MEPLATEAVNQLRPQSLLSMTSASGEVFYGSAAYDKRRTYIRSNNDQALPPIAQDAFVAESGVDWNVQNIDTGHSPFSNEPRKLAEIVVSNVKAFIETY